MRYHNSQKRIYGDYIYFITCVVYDREEFFHDKIFCELWVKELGMCKEMYQFKLYAFCLNYDHFHLLVKPNNDIANYSDIMRFIKRNFSQNCNKILGYNHTNIGGDDVHHRHNAFPKTTIPKTTMTKTTIPKTTMTKTMIPKTTMRIVDFGNREHRKCRKRIVDFGNREHRKPWQIEMDEYVLSLRGKFIDKFGDESQIPKFKWQKSFYDHIIRNQRDYDNHWNYTMHNFRKHELPENWKYTGLKYPQLIDNI